MKRIFTITGALYASFAILTAYSALGPGSPSVADNHNNRANVAEGDGSHLPLAGMVWREGAYVSTARVIVYSIPGCGGCVAFKRDAVPTLIAEGITVEIIDAYIDPPEDKTITSFPTIIVFDGDTEVKRWVGNTPVSDVLATIPQAIEPPEPPDYRIWDNIKRWLGVN
jgi:hypothetical protein